MWPAGRTAIVAMGCMRLSTDLHRDEDRAIETLHAALDAGVDLFDTADSYCHDTSDIGHNERLVAAAIASWPGDRSRILVATKGGLTRPQGHWVADGRASHLRAACEASLRALALDRLPLYQLHAPDPRVPLATSVRALERLRQDGYIEAIGLCNVTLGQLEEARRIADIASVQVELSPWADAALLSGLVAYCTRHGIRLFAHRPLGGEKRIGRMMSDPVLSEIASRHGRTPADVVLAWLAGLSPAVTPLAGPTRPETARSVAHAATLALNEEDWHQLGDRFPATQLVRPRHEAPAPRRDGEVVLIIGVPASGKSTMARAFTDRGLVRLNRDEQGGTLRKLLPGLQRAVEAGATRIVLDNTYASRAARGAVVQWARQHGLPVRCIWMTTGLDDAQVNAVERIVRKYGRLLEPDEIRAASRRDPNTFGPAVLFRFQREFEPPDPSEGFSAIEAVPFTRHKEPGRTGRAVLVWCDGVLARSRSGRRVAASVEDLEVLTERRVVLERSVAEGYRLIALSWQPEIDDGLATRQEVDAILARMVAELGVPIDVLYCSHRAGPPVCWCRNPLPGLGVLAIERYALDPAASLVVGQGPQDPGFARKLGMAYRDAEAFFEDSASRGDSQGAANQRAAPDVNKRS